MAAAVAVAPSSVQQQQQQEERPKMELLQRRSLYVGDLDPRVTEMDLRVAFCVAGPILSVKLCRCCLTGKSLRYGYVNFCTHAQASRALDLLNHTNLKGKPMRLMWSQRDPLARKTGVANLFVKNLDALVNSTYLERIFSKFGTVLSCKVVEEDGKSKGFGFVQFESEDSAIAAQTALHDTVVEGKKIYVSQFLKKSERIAAGGLSEESKFTNLYVKNLAESLTEDGLKDKFSVFGDVSNAVIMRDQEGKSRCFGFVNFKSPEDAKNAVVAMNGSLVDSKVLFVGKAENRAERTKMLKQEYMDMQKGHAEKLKASNVYVNNLNVSIDDGKLQEIFSACGTILSAKVMCHDDGASKGFGFVCFSSPEEAKRALDKLNGAIVEGKTLYVAKAQCKKDHHLELHNSVLNQQPHSFYPSNSRTFFPPVFPLPFNPTQFPQLPFLHQPVLYQHSGEFGVRYPFAARNYPQKFSTYIPVAETKLGSTLNSKAQSYHHRPHSMKPATSYFSNQNLNCGYAGGRSFGSKKKGKRGEAAENISAGSPATCLAAADFTESTTRDVGNILQPLVKKFHGRYQKAGVERIGYN